MTKGEEDADGRPIPGTILVPGRRFLYIEDEAPETFSERFNRIGDHVEARLQPLPQGGMITENVALRTPVGTLFCALSFKGDLDRWEAGIVSYAAENDVRVARVEGTSLLVDDGTVWMLPECFALPYQVQGGRRNGRLERHRPTRGCSASAPTNQVASSRRSSISS